MTEYEKHREELIKKGKIVDKWGKTINPQEQKTNNNNTAKNIIFTIIAIIILLNAIQQLFDINIVEYIKNAINFYINNAPTVK